MRRVAIPACITVLGLVSCVTLPSGPEKTRSDAIGSVTASSLLFTPLDASPLDDTRLSFGPLRDEKKLAKAILSPQIGATYLQYKSLEAALAVRLPGPVVTTTETATRTIQDLKEAESFARERKRTFATPDAPDSLPTPPEAPQTVEQAMVDLLSRSGSTYQLQPDEVATLVAAYKTYMVNLEEYYNVQSFSFDQAASMEWVPYKVHFTVTADPGWFTRYHDYDAVLDLTLGEDGGESEYRILTISPIEAGQTIDQLSAELDRLALALAASGNTPSAAASAEVRSVNETAQRLEGLRRNKTLTVAFPAENTVRVRFRPFIVPAKDEQDLQPTSRILTGIVLVRNVDSGSKPAKALAPMSADDIDVGESRLAPYKRELEVELQKLRSSGSPLSASLKNATAESFLADPRLFDRVSGLRGGSALESAAAALRSEAERRLPARYPIAGRRCRVRQEAYFSAGLTENGGKSSAPRNWFLFRSREYERRDVEALCRGDESAWVPPWIRKTDSKVTISRAFGYYWSDLAPVERAKAAADAARLELNALNERIDKLNGEIVSKKGAVAEKASKLESEEAAAKASSGGQKKKKNSAGASPGVSAAKDALAKAKGELGELEDQRKRLANEKTALADAAARARASYERALGRALGKGRASIGFAAFAPPFHVGKDLTVVDAEAWARVVGLRRDESEFWRVGSGGVFESRQFVGVDLSQTTWVDKDGKTQFRNLRGFVEVVLMPRGAPAPTSLDEGLSSAVLEVEFEPREEAPALPAPGPAGAGKPAGGHEVEGVEAKPEPKKDEKPSAPASGDKSEKKEA